MATLADSLVSTSSRKLSLRRRGDLSIRTQRHQGKQFYIVKDPVGLGYFRLREEEYAVLEWLDGETSLDEIKERFEKRFAPQQLTLKQLQFFLGQLHRNGLIISHVEGQGEQLAKRRGEKVRREVMGKLTNILAIRFKGIDPEQLLVWMHKYLGWLYSTWFTSLCIAFMLSAAALIMVQFEEFISRLPAFHEFFQVKNAVWLGIILMITKVIHEFGHGLTCKHYGGECHEIGIMFLVLTPCLYCNVSDSWMLPNKWHRIFISIGGMYVELVIASICTFIWWFTEPGFLNYLALSTIFVCSVSTILFNGNPLLRYDGYYVLSDLLEIPNLWQKSRSVLHRFLGQVCLGLKFPPDPFLPEKNHFLFGTYAVASSIYRWIVLLSILWFLNEVFEPYNLQIIGQMIAATSIIGLVVMPMYKMIKFFWVPGRMSQVKPLRFLATLSIVALVVGGLFFYEFDRRVFTTLVVEPQDAERVYVTVPGELAKVEVRPGQRVAASEPLARLTNDDIDLQITEARHKLVEQEEYLDNLRKIQVNMTEAANQIPQAEKTRDALREQLAERQIDAERLLLAAPIAGTVLPPDRKPEPPASQRKRQLRQWLGTPLDSQNTGAFFEPGTLFCMIGDPQRLEAVLVIDQGDIEFISTGDEVEIMLDKLPGKVFRGKITEIAESELEVAPEALSAKAGGALATRTEQGTGLEQPMSTSYQARVPLDLTDEEAGLLLGVRGEAKIRAGQTTLAQVVYRYLRQTFNFD